MILVFKVVVCLPRFSLLLFAVHVPSSSVFVFYPVRLHSPSPSRLRGNEGHSEKNSNDPFLELGQGAVCVSSHIIIVSYRIAEWLESSSRTMHCGAD